MFKCINDTEILLHNIHYTMNWCKKKSKQIKATEIHIYMLR